MLQKYLEPFHQIVAFVTGDLVNNTFLSYNCIERNKKKKECGKNKTALNVTEKLVKLLS